MGIADIMIFFRHLNHWTTRILMVDAGRGAPGLVAGGPDDIAICVGQFPGCAQVVRMHMQSLALQRLGGGGYSCGTKLSGS